MLGVGVSGQRFLEAHNLNPTVKGQQEFAGQTKLGEEHSRQESGLKHGGGDGKLNNTLLNNSCVKEGDKSENT